MGQIIFVDVLEDHFRRAAAHIETNGWYKGTWFSQRDFDSDTDLPTDCPSCILGSLLVACKSDNITHFMEARTSLYFRVTSHYLDYMEGMNDDDLTFGSIVEWNDLRARSAEEVVARLTEAADDVKHNNTRFQSFVKYVQIRDDEVVFKWRN